MVLWDTLQSLKCFQCAIEIDTIAFGSQQCRVTFRLCLHTAREGERENVSEAEREMRRCCQGPCWRSFNGFQWEHESVIRIFVATLSLSLSAFSMPNQLGAVQARTQCHSVAREKTKWDRRAARARGKTSMNAKSWIDENLFCLSHFYVAPYGTRPSLMSLRIVPLLPHLSVPHPPLYLSILSSCWYSINLLTHHNGLFRARCLCPGSSYWFIFAL